MAGRQVDFLFYFKTQFLIYKFWVQDAFWQGFREKVRCVFPAWGLRFYLTMSD